MAQGDILKRFLDAGVEFTQMTRERAEKIVQELVESGDIRRREAQKRIEELVERGQKSTEDLVATIRKEVADQLRNLGLDDLARRADADADASNQTSVGANVSETRNAADDAYPAPPAAPIKAAVKKAARKATKKSAAKKAGGTKKA
ncbi:MAG TPA: hypothetical protein VFV35_01135 [Acidimicrobiales bacterium]|nr:hypothetical protein [Acidimicrobiales bacterium]